MARLHAHVESHKSWRAAAEAMMTTARAELAVDATATSGNTVSKQTIPASPVRTRSNTSGARARRSSSGIQEESALETLLGSLAVSLPCEEESPRARVNAISKAVAERARKCDEVAKGAQESLEITTRAHLSDAKLALQLLRDSLLAESPFGEVKLVDPVMEGSILILQQEVEKAKEKLRSLEGQSVMARSVKKEEFVRRWGS